MRSPLTPTAPPRATVPFTLPLRALAGAALLAATVASASCKAGGASVESAGVASCTGDWSVYKSGRVDTTVLFVVDDTASMCDDQANLRDNVAELAEWWEDRAWGYGVSEIRLGVVSTDLAAGGALRTGPGPNEGTCGLPLPPLDCASDLPRWFDPRRPDFEEWLLCQTATVSGREGAGDVLGAVRMALASAFVDESPNEDFYLPGSQLVIVLITDEDDCSVCEGDACTALSTSAALCAARAAELTPPEEIAAFVRALPDGQGGTLGETGVVVLTATGGARLPGGGPPGADGSLPLACNVAGVGSAAAAPRVEAFARAFDEHEDYIAGSLCNPNWSDWVMPGYATPQIAPPCLPVPPCAGVGAVDLEARIENAYGTFLLVPFVDYVLVCDDENALCTRSATEDCPGGWLFELLVELPADTKLHVLYPCDVAGACER